MRIGVARLLAHGAIVALTCVTLAGCPEQDPPTAPSPFGEIQGVVTINGGAAPGITVTSGQTTVVTAANGSFWMLLLSGENVVTVSGFPSDVTFPATSQTVRVRAREVVSVSFAGVRVSSPFTNHTGVLSVAGGNGSHDPFVFTAGAGKAVAVLLHVDSPTAIRITPEAGFAPSALPELIGTIDGSGQISLNGSGTIAGVAGVSVRAIGTQVNGRLDVELFVGEDGKLPGGQPIRYRFLTN